MQSALIRPVEAQDIPRLYEIDAAAFAAFGNLTREAFTHLLFDLADVAFVAVQNRMPVGFVMCLIEGQTYASPNYNWISRHYVTFAYVERTATAKIAQGMRLGARLYEKTFLHYGGRRPVLLAKVGLRPPNPRLLQFHEQMGFRNTGRERWEKDGGNGTVFLERSLLEFID